MEADPSVLLLEIKTNNYICRDLAETAGDPGMLCHQVLGELHCAQKSQLIT